MLDDATSSSPLVLVLGIVVGYFVRAPSGGSQPPKPAETCQNITEVRLKRPFLVQFVDREGLETEFLIGILLLVILLLLFNRRREGVPARKEPRAKILLVK